MKFQDIEEDGKVYPGEYLLHNPTKQIVVCGAYKPQEGTIKAMANGRLIEDKVSHFQQINLEAHERMPNAINRCGGCKK